MSTEATSKYLRDILGDGNSRSAYSQMLIGISTGWLTGFTTMKIGKIPALTIGGGIILLEIAKQEGYIEIDWSKINTNLYKVSDKIETIGRKLDRGEELVRLKSSKAKRWYSKLIGDENGPKVNDLHIFLASFVGGVAVGIASA